MNSAVEGNKGRPASRGRVADERNVEDKSEWHAATFEKRISESKDWKKSEGRKKPSRVQDIVVPDNSNHNSNAANDSKSWPYEDGPCRMFDGKNTKAGPEAEALNKEYFDPTFANRHRSNETEMRFEDADVDELVSESGHDVQMDGDAGENMDIDQGTYDNGIVVQVKKRATTASTLREQQMKFNSITNRKPNAADQYANNTAMNLRMSRRGSTGSGLIAAAAGAQNGSTTSRNIFSTATRRSSATGASSLKKTGSGFFGLSRSDSSDDLKNSSGRGSRSSLEFASSHQNHTEEPSKRAFGIFRLSRSSSQPNINKSDLQQYNQEKKSTSTAIISTHAEIARNTVETMRSSMRRQSLGNINADVEDDTDCQHQQSRANASSTSVKRVSRRSSTGGSTGLNSTTYHGEATTKIRNGRTTSRRNGGVTRHKSSDDPSILQPNHKDCNVQSSRRSRSQDELGTATLHGTGGKSAVSRIRRNNGSSKEAEVNESRSGRRSSTTDNGGTSDRRSKFKRAMSTENVRRPEDYGPNTGKVVVETEESMIKRRGGRRSSATNKANIEAARRFVEEKTSSSSSSDDNADSDDESFADDGVVVLKGRSVDKNYKEKRATIQPPKSEAATRDVLELLHDNKTIKLRDMQDKDNRSMIHFFLFEHKMGVSLAQMKKSIQQDIADDPEEALRRLPLPLYVPEPTN